MTAAYERLLAIAREQVRLVAEGRLDALEPLAGEWQEIVAGLPPGAPSDAIELLRETERLVRSMTAALEASRAGAGEEIGRLSRGRRAMAGYGGEAASSVRVSA
ncbi:MAG: hypothetical protein ACKVUT_03900 [Gaiella sp.]